MGREDRGTERDAHDKSWLMHHGSNGARADRDFESLISSQCGLLLCSLICVTSGREFVMQRVFVGHMGR